MSYPAPSVKFEICYGVSSPWAYFGHSRAVQLAQCHRLKLHLKPILVLETNGGIPLKFRPPARLKYHALELQRWSEFLNIPINLKPKHYPVRNVRIPAQAIIRLQNIIGIGHEKVLAFSFAIQKGIWWDEKDVADLDVLKELGKEVGVDEIVLERVCVDRTGDENDEAVKEWNENFRYAEEIGCFGTPNYVVNGEIFWGQDRLDFVERRLLELQANSRISAF